jgi:hypothetical protein
MTSGLATETEATPGTAAIGRPKREDEAPLVVATRRSTASDWRRAAQGRSGMAQLSAELDAELYPANFGAFSDGSYLIALTGRRNEISIRRPLPVRQGVERAVAMRRNCRADTGVVPRGTTSALKVVLPTPPYSTGLKLTARKCLFSRSITM